MRWRVVEKSIACQQSKWLEYLQSLSAKNALASASHSFSFDYLGKLLKEDFHTIENSGKWRNVNQIEKYGASRVRKILWGLDTNYCVNIVFDSPLFCNIFNNFSYFTQASIVVLPMLFSSFIAAVPFTGTHRMQRNISAVLRASDQLWFLSWTRIPIWAQNFTSLRIWSQTL